MKTLSIKSIYLPCLDISFEVKWDIKDERYFIESWERGELIEEFTNINHYHLPTVRNDDAAIRAVQAYADEVYEELSA